ncbi:MAG: hypothetical protein AB7K24_32220, partial [Gemmataceae bacterium]
MSRLTGSASTKRAEEQALAEGQQAEDPARASAQTGPGGEEAARSPEADRSRENCQLWPFYCSLVTFRRRMKLLPARALAAQPRLLAVAHLLLLGFAAVLFSFARRTEPAAVDEPAPEIVLRTEPPSPNLNLNRTPEPEVSAHPTEPETPPAESNELTLPAEEPVEVPVAPELPAPLPDLQVEPVVAVQRYTEPALHVQTHPGDSPMIKNWKMLGMQALLAGSMLATAQATAQDDKKAVEPNANEVILKQLKELTKAITDMQEQMKSLDSKALDSKLE